MDSVLITILCVYVLRFDWEKKKKKAEIWHRKA